MIVKAICGAIVTTDRPFHRGGRCVKCQKKAGYGDSGYWRRLSDDLEETSKSHYVPYLSFHYAAHEPPEEYFIDEDDQAGADAAYDPEAPDGGHAAGWWAEVWPESVDYE